MQDSVIITPVQLLRRRSIQNLQNIQISSNTKSIIYTPKCSVERRIKTAKR